MIGSRKERGKDNLIEILKVTNHESDYRDTSIQSR